MRFLIENLQEKVEVTEEIEKVIEDAVKNTLISENFNKPCEVAISLVDNEQIHQLNKEHRDMDKPTDVLSFPLVDFNQEEDDEFGYDDGYLMLGDIILSMEKAVEQAQEYGHSAEREIGFLCVHSTLHLLGYDHDTDENTKTMRDKEEAVLSKMSLTR